ncbi:hypothetical protein MTsPCn9_28440 [Croceitalea sp. MTPC9]|uniref:hypothetical protein n=1 Tax=unclassified Croceitalea TaxID=2632280 RepID=UPI002B3BA81A|nr:hypothetical protein MTsPCn6_29930 [Croceitalea sp. MTPC6]GMN17904.1 hypothetical protein MTsPCn9_28440 [Croceitalea sp. MTPC9]
MDNQEELEKLIDNLMASDSLEVPSHGFTQKVVEKAIKGKSQQLEYKPLLPKWILSLAAILIVGLVVYGIDLYATSGTSTSYFEDLNKIGVWSSDFFAQLNFSKTLTYSIVIFGLMICLHTLVLKKYFENRLA